MSRLVFVALCCALAVVIAKPQPKHDVTVCASKPGDKVLSFLQVSDEGHYLGKSSLDVVYPPEGEPENYVINCIMVKDLKPDVGATATITNGTLGSSRVSIHLESSFTKGLSFSVKIMGQ
ncbi:uncharacterized protein LOC124164211 [Ischnura elegans]|uniref:uncharacterized protein LOC124164211 n=1 Tax=Ischnura elegans TaxID=197161 RepID=UPI001ED866C9|nr:uncharacterized protein LOC124164211 [Ischnura elegans]